MILLEWNTRDFIVALNPKDFPQDRLKANIVSRGWLGGEKHLLKALTEDSHGCLTGETL